MTKPEGTITTLPDGRVVFTKKRPEGAARSLEAAVPGELGAMLRDAGYRARVVIEREDGAGVSDHDREAADDLLMVASEMLDTSLRDRVLARRVARGDAREGGDAPAANDREAASG